MRKVNEMFHIENEQLIKTSNGEAIPEDEPVFILRGRDALALATLVFYQRKAKDAQVHVVRRGQLLDVEKQFREFRQKNPQKMKQPGVTMGR